MAVLRATSANPTLSEAAAAIRDMHALTVYVTRDDVARAALYLGVRVREGRIERRDISTLYFYLARRNNA